MLKAGTGCKTMPNFEELRIVQFINCKWKEFYKTKNLPRHGTSPGKESINQKLSNYVRSFWKETKTVWPKSSSSKTTLPNTEETYIKF